MDKNKIIPYGKSLGGSIVTYLADQRDVYAVILDSSFTSISDMAVEMFPFGPIKYFLSMKYDTIGRIGDIGVPKLIIHSPEDRVVPFSHAERLFANAKEPKKLCKIFGSHNEAFC